MGRAKAKGVERIIVTAGSVQDLHESVDLCKRFEGKEGKRFLSTTLGIHPTRASEYAKNPRKVVQELRSLWENNAERVVAVGEIGLDYDRLQFSSVDQQRACFEAMLEEFAVKLNLPLFLHMRNCAGDFFEIMNKVKSKHPEIEFRGVVHSFTGTAEESAAVLAAGFDIGLNGCSMKTEENLNVIKRLPLERIHLETDAPWCDIRRTHASWSVLTAETGGLLLDTPASKAKEKWSPDSHVKSRCEPADIVSVAKVVASLHGVSLNEVATRAYENSMKLFFSAQ